MTHFCWPLLVKACLMRLVSSSLPSGTDELMVSLQLCELGGDGKQSLDASLYAWACVCFL